MTFLARLIALTLVVAGLGVVGCQPREAAKRKQIVVWGLSIGPDSKGQDALIREFERRNPGYEVQVLGMGAGRMDPQKLMTSIVGNVPPDIIYQDRFTISDWASRGAFVSLNSFIERDRANPNTPTPEQYYPATWSEATWEGRVYGIPSGVDTRVLYYNRDVFRRQAAKLRAAGLDPERPPRTWTEVLAYSRVLTEKNPDGTLKTVGFLPNYGNTWLYLFSFQNNGSFLSPDGRTCTLTAPENLQALEFMVRGYELVGGFSAANAFTTGFQGAENDPFIRGRIAMKVDGDWIINGLSRYGLKLDFGVAPAPVPDDRYFRRGRFADETDQFITWSGGFSWAIPKGARNIEGAWKFIQFAASLEGRTIDMRAQREWERRKGRVFVPRVQALIAANEVIEREFMPADPRVKSALQAHIDVLPVARMRPATPIGQVLWDEHVRALESACMGLQPPIAALQTAQDKVQRELDALYSERELPRVDMRVPVVSSLIVATILIAAAILVYRRAGLGATGRHEARWAYFFIAPWVIGFLVFTLGPIVASLFFSFTRYNVLNEARWVGVGNYQTLATTDFGNVLKAFGNVLFLGGIGVPLGLMTGLAIAVVLNLAVGGMRVYRTLFYMPSIVPVVASAVLWIWILSPDPNQGLLNAGWRSTIGAWFGIAPPGWLQAPEWAKPALIIMGLWGAGGGMLLWLAGLKGIPKQLYEAANIDGATSWRQFWSITVPQLSPIIFFNAVMGFIGALQEFDRAVIMGGVSGTGPGDSLLVPVTHLFKNGFHYFKLGYASALAWVIFFVVLGLTLIQFRLAPRWVHYEVDK